jgi:hypothetical protein
LHQVTGYHAASPTSVAPFTIEARIIAKKPSQTAPNRSDAIYRATVPVALFRKPHPTVAARFIDHAASPTSVAPFTIEARIIAKKPTEVIVVLITIFHKPHPTVATRFIAQPCLLLYSANRTQP